MKLSSLIEKLDYELYSGSVDCDITTLTYDSRKVEEGSLFVCISGAVRDAHDFIPDVIEKGAKAIIIEKDCLKIYSSGKYHIIRWSEVQDFKSVHMSKVRNMFYPIYKDDKRNGSRIGMQFHRDAFYCDYLTISEQELFELLKKHID